MTAKICVCGANFSKPPRYSRRQWERTKFCCQACAGRHNVRIAKGGWNKFRHGASYSRTYLIHRGMLQRCNNPNHRHFSHYGARGISVCERWRDFQNFLEDMGEAPEGLTIERVDNSRGYEKSNCRWATRLEQAQNTRLAKRIECGGRILSVAAWARVLGVGEAMLRSRARRRGDQRAVAELFASREALSQ